MRRHIARLYRRNGRNNLRTPRQEILARYQSFKKLSMQTSDRRCMPLLTAKFTARRRKKNRERLIRLAERHSASHALPTPLPPFLPSSSRENKRKINKKKKRNENSSQLRDRDELSNFVGQKCWGSLSQQKFLFLDGVNREAAKWTFAARRVAALAGRVIPRTPTRSSPIVIAFLAPRF